MRRLPAILALCLFVAIVFVGAIHGDESDASNGVSDDPIAFDPDEGIRLPVEVFGEQHQFLMATCSPVSRVDTSFRNRLGPALNTSQYTFSPPVHTAALFKAPIIKIGRQFPVSFESQKPVICLDVSQIGMATGFDEKGVIGMDFLCSRVLRIDADERRVQIRRTATPGDYSQTERITFKQEVPWILIRVSDRGFHSFMIDAMPHDNVYLEAKLFQQLCARGRIVEKSMTGGMSLAGATANRYGVLDQLEFGPHRFRNVRVQVGPTNSIKLSFLARFDVELDFPNRTAYFRPSKMIDAPFRWNRAGFGVKRANGKTFVAPFELQGSAAEQGLREGDELVEINGVAAHECRVEQIRRWRSDPDAKEMTVSFQRDGVAKKVVLNLLDEPDPFPQKEEPQKTGSFDE